MIHPVGLQNPVIDDLVVPSVYIKHWTSGSDVDQLERGSDTRVQIKRKRGSWCFFWLGVLQINTSKVR
ncbi:hypothetical protein DB347_17815 [Opitutaceae bacterium EW11]|nr:hypothetical protein DB347_17815 [Opitutaceae bacterium EW11]